MNENDIKEMNQTESTIEDFASSESDFASEETQDFTTCFAYEKCKSLSSGELFCGILQEDLCKKNGKCSFFKTRKQFDEDLEKYNKINKAKRAGGNNAEAEAN